MHGSMIPNLQTMVMPMAVGILDSCLEWKIIKGIQVLKNLRAFEQGRFFLIHMNFLIHTQIATIVAIRQFMGSKYIAAGLPSQTLLRELTVLLTLQILGSLSWI